jgi:pseudouridine synthase
VFGALPKELPRLISIGRLDLNSEGLLLLTNDGALARRLELPSTGWLRRYKVRVHARNHRHEAIRCRDIGNVKHRPHLRKFPVFSLLAGKIVRSTVLDRSLR